MYDLINADFDSDDIQYYEIVFPDTDITTIEFAGLVTELPINISPKDAVAMDVVIEIDGKPVTNSGVNSGSPS
jgi:hypothetical protein